MTREQKLARILEIKKRYGWTNKVIANGLNTTENYVKNVLSPGYQKELPKWVDAMIFLDGKNSELLTDFIEQGKIEPDEIETFFKKK